MNIPWTMLFEFIAEMVAMCMAEGRPDGEIRDAIAEPGRREWRAIRRKLRRMNWRGEINLRERRAYLKGIEEQVGKVGSNVISELIEAAKEQNEDK